MRNTRGHIVVVVVVVVVVVFVCLFFVLFCFVLMGVDHLGGGHSHLEVTGMCGHDPQSRGLLVTD